MTAQQELPLPPRLKAIVKATSKKFGKDFSGNDYGDLEGLSTGSSTLDAATGIGGFPRGRVTEVFGWESSGKTSLCTSVMVQAQKQRREQGITDKRDLVIDLEHSLTSNFLKGIGIDMGQIVWVRPDTAEEALQIAIDYPKSGEIDTVMFDSVDAAQNNRQLARTVGETDVGGISKEMNRALREISKESVKTNTTYMFINQIKQNPGQMMGNPNVTPGGNALKFYTAMRLELMRGQPSPDVPGALLMRVKMEKTKVAPPISKKKPIELHFLYGKGFDPILDLMLLAKDLEILRFAGPTCKVKWTEEGEEETLASGGKAGVYEALRDEELFLRLKAAAFTKAGLQS